MEFQNLYFEDELIKKIKKLRIIKINSNELEIDKLDLMMNENNSKIVLEDQQSDFSFNKSKSNLDINFLDLFIFFVFLLFH